MKLRTPRVALLIETSSSYGRGLLGGIADYARRHGPWSLFIEPGGLEGPLPRLEGWGAEGIIALLRSRRQARRILSMGVPTVDLDAALPDLVPWGVLSDEGALARLAAEHLRACGLREFAFCGWGRRTWWDDERERQFCGALGAAGMGVHVYPRPRTIAEQAWGVEQKALARWLRSLPRPVGILAANDQRGRHVLEAVRRAGLRAPQDAAVLGVDDDQVLCEMGSPSLSSIALNTRRIGYEAARMLHGLIRGRRPPRKTLLIEPLGVVSRESTDVLAVEDAAVAGALRFIRDNVHRPIRVADVLEHVPVSRRTLEVRFQQALGRTPHAEIDRARLQRVKELLTRTDWPLKKIAAASGFSYVEHLYAVFRAQTGTTPAHYRRVSGGR